MKKNSVTHSTSVNTLVTSLVCSEGDRGRLCSRSSSAGTEEGDARRLLPDGVGDDKAADHQPQHQQRLFQQARIGDGVGFPVIHHPLPVFCAGVEPAPPDEVDGQQDDGQQQQHQRGQVEDEVVESQSNGGPDHDVGRNRR